MATFPTGWDGLPDNRDAKEQEQKNDSYTISYKPQSNRICSRNDTMAKTPSIPTVFINLPLQWQTVEGHTALFWTTPSYYDEHKNCRIVPVHENGPV
jgi:hypothetical protein